MTGVSFGSLFEFIRNGLNVKQDRSGSGLPISRIETISDGLINPKRVGYAGLSTTNSSGWLLEPGDILFSHINSAEHIGKCAVFHGQPEILIHGMNLLCLRSKKELLSPHYGKYLIRSNQFRSELSKSIKKAVNQASVSIRDLNAIQITLPTLNDQHRIAAILDGADALQVKRRAMLARLDEMAKAIFVEKFGDPIANSMAWPLRQMCEVGQVVTGNTPSRATSENYGGDIEWIKSDNLGTSNYYATKAEECLSPLGLKSGRTAPVGAILVTCIAGSPNVIGNCSMLDRKAAFNQQINALIPAKVNPHFAYAYLKICKSLVQAESTASMKGMVSKSRFERIPFMVPPRPMQDDFANQVLRLLDLRGKVVAAHTAGDTLFASLQHRAFTGAL